MNIAEEEAEMQYEKEHEESIEREIIMDKEK